MGWVVPAKNYFPKFSTKNILHLYDISSICKLFIFSSSLKPLNRFGPNLAEMFIWKVPLNDIKSQSLRNASVLSDMTSKFFLLRTDTRLVFCNRKLIRTDIFFTRTSICKLFIFSSSLKPLNRFGPNLAEMFIWKVLYQICYFGADRKSNMAARAHNVFWLVEI
jgi:hypothetical protein